MLYLRPKVTKLREIAVSMYAADGTKLRDVSDFEEAFELAMENGRVIVRMQ